MLASDESVGKNEETPAEKVMLVEECPNGFRKCSTYNRELNNLSSKTGSVLPKGVPIPKRCTPHPKRG